MSFQPCFRFSDLYVFPPSHHLSLISAGGCIRAPLPPVPDTTAVQCLWLQIISLKPDSHSAGCKLLTSSIYECQTFQGGKGGGSRAESVPLNGIHQPYHIYKLTKRTKWSSLELAGSSSTSWFYEILIQIRHVSVLESVRWKDDMVIDKLLPCPFFWVTSSISLLAVLVLVCTWQDKAKTQEILLLKSKDTDFTGNQKDSLDLQVIPTILTLFHHLWILPSSCESNMQLLLQRCVRKGLEPEPWVLEKNITNCVEEFRLQNHCLAAQQKSLTETVWMMKVFPLQWLLSSASS